MGGWWRGDLLLKHEPIKCLNKETTFFKLLCGKDLKSFVFLRVGDGGYSEGEPGPMTVEYEVRWGLDGQKPLASVKSAQGLVQTMGLGKGCCSPHICCSFPLVYYREARPGPTSVRGQKRSKEF